MSGRGLAGALLRFSGTEQARFNRLCPVTITLKLSCWMAINRRASVSKGSDAFALTLRSIRLAIRIRAFAARGTQLDTRPVSPYKRLATFINRVDFKSVRFHIDQKKGFYQVLERKHTRSLRNFHGFGRFKSAVAVAVAVVFVIVVPGRGTSFLRPLRPNGWLLLLGWTRSPASSVAALIPTRSPRPR